MGSSTKISPSSPQPTHTGTHSLSIFPTPPPPPPQKKKKVTFAQPVDDRTCSFVPGLVGRLQDLARLPVHKQPPPDVACAKVYELFGRVWRQPKWMCAEIEVEKVYLRTAGIRVAGSMTNWGMRMEEEEKKDKELKVEHTDTGIGWFSKRE